MNEAEEKKLREKWFSSREEQKKDQDSDDSSKENDEHTAGMELIPLKDLFTVSLCY